MSKKINLDKYQYDETETGLKIGTAINTLQELL